MELLKHINNIREDLKTNIIHLNVARIVIHVNSREEFNSLIRELDNIDGIEVRPFTRRSSYDAHGNNLCIEISYVDGKYMTSYSHMDWYKEVGFKIIEYNDIRGSLYYK